MTRIKICGLFRPEDILAVNEAKPDYIGFVFAPSHRQVTLEQSAGLRQHLSQQITTVGVFRNANPEFIYKASDRGIIDMVQLHGSEDEAYLQNIRKYTGRPVIKAISVICPEDIQRWQGSAANYLLFDNGAGGTGQSFDWSLIGNNLKPFFLAGGLNAENIRHAVNQVQPFAVDVSSGVETGGMKDAQKIQTIVRRIRNE